VRRLLVSLGLAALAASAIAAPAAAAQPAHDKFAPYTVTVNLPAGTLCDFNFRQVFTEQDSVTAFSDGHWRLKAKVTDTNWNLDTGATLTESVNWVLFGYSDHVRMQGLFWHLRDAHGKVVTVQAGQMIFGPDGVKFTPNANPSIPGVLCPALGGNPA
jgi:hypothetical protein